MNQISKYLDKQKDLSSLINSGPSEDLEMVITIPCHNEPDILSTLESINSSFDFYGSVEVIILINQSEDCEQKVADQNENSYNDILVWMNDKAPPSIHYYPIKKVFSAKKAGVGSARKTAMDEAARRLSLAANPNGIITGLDADSMVQTNYIKSILDHFNSLPKSGAASIHYEHPVSGNNFGEEIYNCIISYELHLRYFIFMQRKLGLPFAFQTIGSSMAVRALNYAQIGGMNRRQAGEDFYFLHKCIKQGGFSEVNTTTVVPSPRISDRVPFGTGKAIGDMISENNNDFCTYHPSSFDVLIPFLSDIDKYFSTDFDLEQEKWHIGLKDFLTQMDLTNKIAEIRKNASSPESFRKRFFHVFDAFLLMKYLHFMRDHHFANIPVLSAVQLVLTNGSLSTPLDALNHFRFEHLSLKIDGLSKNTQSMKRNLSE